MDFQFQITTADPVDVQIERYFRRQIQTGSLKAGQHLPSNPELAQKWGVSCTTVQKALARLSASGMLQRAPRRGTVVVNGTGKMLVCVVFGPSLAEEAAHFYRATLRAMKDEMQEHRWSYRVYDGFADSRGLPRPRHSQVYRDLANDLRNYSFKGLVEFSPGRKGLAGLEALVSSPRVCFEALRDDTDCELDRYQFGWKCVEFLAKHGRRNICYLRTALGTTLHSEEGDLSGFQDAVHKFGLPSPRVESITAAQSDQLERETYEKTLLLFRSWRTRKGAGGCPDALLVSDDVAMRAVALALVQSDIKVPSDLMVVSHANEGVNLHYGIPVVRYEISPKEIVRQLLDILGKRVLGQPLSSLPIMIRGQIKETNL